ncbi:MAG: trypsin-like serine protease [Pseudomonadota bacterium]
MFDPFETEDLLTAADYAADPAIIGGDGRRLVTNSRVMPYAAVCYIERSFGGGRVGCTGTLIAPDLVLTAGHCLIRASGRVPRTMNIQPGRNGSYRAETIPAKRAWVARGFVHGRNPLFDYGLIKLARPIRNTRNVVPMHRPTRAQLLHLKRTGRIRVAGYPSDKAKGTMWEHQEKLIRFDTRRLIHVVDTCPGHSGSAIMAPINGRPRVIGIHVAGIRDPKTGRSYGCRPGSTGAPAGGFNRAVRLSSRVMSAFTGGTGLGDYGLIRTWSSGR